MFSDVSLGDVALAVIALSVAYLVFRLGAWSARPSDPEETRLSLRTTSANVQPTLVKLTDTVGLTNDQLARSMASPATSRR